MKVPDHPKDLVDFTQVCFIPSTLTWKLSILPSIKFPIPENSEKSCSNFKKGTSMMSNDFSISS